MAEYIYESDILEVDTQVIVQQCHCMCTSKTAKGLSASIIEAFPHADFYSERVQHSKPGTIEMRGGGKKGRFVCALYAQVFPGGPGKEGDSIKERESYFLKCLMALGRVKNIKEVAFPYGIGCGLAKGDWETYANMIEEFADNHDHIKVFVISQEPEPKEVSEEEPEEHSLDKAFVKWVCRQIKTDPELLREAPGLLLRLQEEYHNYLHNVVEDDEQIGNLTAEDPEELEECETWETTTLEEYTESNMPEGWEAFFTEQLDVDTGSIHELSKYLFGELQKGEIYPELHLIYNAFTIRPEDIRVVLIGQDPYINPGEALGISFSVPEGVDIPPSLRNIYKELKDDGFTVSDTSKGDLTKWCEQGVFLINSALTVRAHESGSHSKKWNENFSGQLMRWINDNCNPLVVIMWGNHAQNFAKLFGDSHRKIMGVHPSPLSANRGFFGSKPFSKANKHLKALGYDEIDWSL